MKNISILGSTGSIGKSLLKIISKNSKEFKIDLLTTNKNYKLLLRQAKKFNVKNLIICNEDTYTKVVKKYKKKNNKIKFYKDFNSFEKIFKKKNDYIMCAISGIEGLKPTYNSIKYTKNIAIANKEAIVCGWKILKNEMKKFKTNFIPVDSEHFSIWYGIKNINKSKIENIYLTASGGPFLNVPNNKIDKLKISDALKHPNWKMGKKISIDSATMMNKVLEIIEARNIFEIELNKLKIITHPDSYLHALIKFNNGIIKFMAHDTTMEIPIFNSIYGNTSKSIKSKKINFEKLNNLNLKKIDQNKFPMIKLLNIINNKNTLFETIIVSANDQLVNFYLQKKIKFSQITDFLFNFLNKSEFKIYKKLKPNNIKQIVNLNNYVRFKLKEMII